MSSAQMNPSRYQQEVNVKPSRKGGTVEREKEEPTDERLKDEKNVIELRTRNAKPEDKY
jgi:hypothetical protein